MNYQPLLRKSLSKRLSTSTVFVLFISLMGQTHALENPIVSQYQQAKVAYSAKQFQKSAELFRGVAQQCPGSELAIQCDYFAAISEWAREPSDAAVAKIADWLIKTTKFRNDALAAGRTFDDKLIQQWMEKSNLLHANWDRQKSRIDAAENRLKSFLNDLSLDNNSTKFAPATWLELGSLLQEDRKEYSAAKDCFSNALACCNDSHEIENQAVLGCARACFHQQQFDEAKSFLDRLEGKKIDESLAIQAKLLQVQLAKDVGESIDVAKALEPIIRLAIASNPQASILYELAMTLLEAGDIANSNEILLLLVHRFPNAPVSIEARVRIARNAFVSKKWQESLKWSEQAIKMDCSDSLRPFAQLLSGQAKLELGDLEGARTDLELSLQHESENIDFKVSARFHLAETLYQLERWQDANVHWKWLMQIAETEPEFSRPEWLPVILLRTAELLALKKEWDQAEQIVLRIRNDFPRCNRMCEVDYLLARCFVSRADFEAARKVLSTVVSSQGTSPPELIARANWMAGETYLLQRNYKEACNSYQQVLLIPKQDYWHSAALMQIGQCCEAMQDTQAARTAYTQIANQFLDSPFLSLAKERLSLLPSNSVAIQPNQITSGPKR